MTDKDIQHVVIDIDEIFVSSSSDESDNNSFRRTTPINIERNNNIKIENIAGEQSLIEYTDNHYNSNVKCNEHYYCSDSPITMSNNNSDDENDHEEKEPSSKYKKISYDEMEKIITNYYDNENKYSNELDILITYLKGQKVLYTYSNRITRWKLNMLTIPSLFFTATLAIFAPFMQNYEWSIGLICVLNGLITLFISLINYLKLESTAEIYLNFANQFDKLETSGSASNLLKSRAGDFTTTSIGYNFSYDQRDSRFNPTSGTLFYYDQNIATFFSDIPTLQTIVGSTSYKKLYKESFIGSAKIKIANVVAFDEKDVKLSDRIFANTSDLRGFEPRGVGPVDNNDHIGGNNLATLSLKSTFPNPIPESLRANTFLFLDVGNVWGVDYSSTILDSSKIRSTTGIALDIVSPIGPLSFTYSIPLSKASTDKEQNFLFNIGSSF